MNTRFKIFASYNILQYLCDFIHVLIFVSVSKCWKKSQINEYSDSGIMVGIRHALSSTRIEALAIRYVINKDFKLNKFFR